MGGNYFLNKFEEIRDIGNSDGSIDTSGTVIDKYRYFPFILFLTGMFAP